MPSPFHILIVEDEALLREYLLDAVGEDYRVSGVSTVREALAVLRTSHVDAAVIDAGLPDGPGDDVSAFAEKQGVPVVFMSGYPEEMFDVNKPGRLHLEKPFKLDVLFSTLKRVLQDSVDGSIAAKSADESAGEARTSGLSSVQPSR